MTFKVVYVKTYLRRFDIETLIRLNIIPHPKRLLKPTFVGHQTEVARNKAYVFFGTLIDYYLRAELNYKFNCIRGEERKKIPKYFCGDWKASCREVYNSVCEDHKGKNVIPWFELNMHYISGIIENITNQFVSPLLSGIRFNDVFKLQLNENSCLYGRPDIVTNECILDIKTTCNLYNMRDEAYLQVLIYYVMHKKLYPNSSIKYVGLVLPLSNEIKLLKVDKWDHENFLKMII